MRSWLGVTASVIHAEYVCGLFQDVGRILHMVLVYSTPQFLGRKARIFISTKKQVL